MMGPIATGDVVKVTDHESQWKNVICRVIGPAPKHLGGWIVQVPGTMISRAPWPPMVFQTDELESL